MTCQSYSGELDPVLAGQLEALSSTDRAEIDGHVQVLKQNPLPEVSNGIRTFRRLNRSGLPHVPELPRGYMGPFWARTERFLIVHVVDSDACRVIVLLCLSEQDLEVSLDSSNPTS